MVFSSLGPELIVGNKETAHIPVIMCTTSNNPDERIQCENLSASDFFLKPISYREMKEIIASILYSKKIRSH